LADSAARYLSVYFATATGSATHIRLGGKIRGNAYFYGDETHKNALPELFKLQNKEKRFYLLP
jgi:hypothetical protein